MTHKRMEADVLVAGCGPAGAARLRGAHLTNPRTLDALHDDGVLAMILGRSPRHAP